MFLKEKNYGSKDSNYDKEEDKKMTIECHSPGQASKTPKRIESRSKKILQLNRFKISFESGLLDSHKTAFHSFFHQYMSTIEPYASKKESPLMLYFHKSKQNQTENHYEKLQVFQIGEILDGLPYPLLEKAQMKVDLLHQTDLSEFIEFFYNEVGPVLGKQFFHIAWIFWDEYTKKSKLRRWEAISIQKIQQNSHERILDHFRETIINLLCFNEETTEILEAFQDCLQKFTYTVYLIIEGFFQNPYDQTLPERSAEDLNPSIEDECESEEEQDDQRGELSREWGLPQKRRKVEEASE